MNPFPQPKSILIMDNASVHNHLDVVNLCAEFRVHCMFLPPYSYDFNPIEPSFHQCKQHIRSTYGTAPRGQQVMIDRLYEGLRSITASDAVGYYHHCGITVTDDDLIWAGLL